MDVFTTLGRLTHPPRTGHGSERTRHEPCCGEGSARRWRRSSGRQCQARRWNEGDRPTHRPVASGDEGAHPAEWIMRVIDMSNTGYVIVYNASSAAIGAPCGTDRGRRVQVPCCPFFSGDGRCLNKPARPNARLGPGRSGRGVGSVGARMVTLMASKSCFFLAQRGAHNEPLPSKTTHQPMCHPRTLLLKRIATSAHQGWTLGENQTSPK